MRNLWILLFLAGCSVPIKYQVFHLAENQEDVLWVFRDGKLHRCWQENGQPICAMAKWVETSPRSAQVVGRASNGKPLEAPGE